MHYAYIAVAGENKILTFRLDPETGKLLFLRRVEVDGGPAPLAVDSKQNFLYAGLRASRHISSFRIDQRTGNLSLIKKIALESDPCYISTDRRGRFLLSAYYGAGKVAVHPIGEDGAAETPPIEWRSTAEKAHWIRTDPSNKFAFVPHPVESNFIFQFKFDENTGHLTPNDPPKLISEEGVGPRHLCFHPTKNFAYSSNEQGCSVTAYNFNPASGTLRAFQTLSTLPKNYSRSNSCAQIHITPNGKFLYVSNRGHDSIAAFSIDEKSGRLISIGQYPSEKTPRAFNIDPTGNFLFAAGQGSDWLASYRIEAQTGALLPLERYEVGKNPMWVLILEFG